MDSSGGGYGAILPEPRTMAFFEKYNNEAFKDLAKEIYQMGSNFFNYVNKQIGISSRRYVSHVIPFRNDQQADRIVQVLQSFGRTRSNGMFGFSVDKGHIHIIHDCAWSDNSCRCQFRKQIEPFGGVKPNSKEVKPMWKFTITDWYDVFLYFFIRKRGTKNLWAGGTSWTEPDNSQLVRWQEKSRVWEEMVRSEDSWPDHVGEQITNKRSYRSTDQGTSERFYEKKSKTASNKFTYIRETTKELMMLYYTTPMTAIRDIPEFRENDILMDPKNKDYVAVSIEDFGRDLNNYTLKDFFELFYEVHEENHPVLNNKLAVFNTSMNYGTLEESVEWINDLLKYQLGDDDSRICEFLQTIVYILDKKLPKCNTLVIKSPPSGGKNFFFDMIFSIIVNYGQLGQANKHNVFAFQEAPNKRLLLWNEPNYESGLTDTIKMMFAGDPYTVRVKHMLDQHVKRTPVIVLTNNYVNFMGDSAFKDRIKIYYWNTAPFLKDIDKKPYPLAFFEILNKYNIEF